MKGYGKIKKIIVASTIIVIASSSILTANTHGKSSLLSKSKNQFVGTVSANRQDEAEPLVPPANDNFANAITVIGAVNNTSGTTLEATKEGGEPNHAGDTGGHSVWYNYTPPFDMAVTFSTRNTNTNFDTLLAVYTGASVAALTQVVANDNHGMDTKSRVTFAAAGNVVYHIAIDGRAGASGNFQLTWRHNPINIVGSDFDGNGINDFGVFRPSNGTWYLTPNGVFQAFQWGQNGDVPVPADYDGDGRTDFAVWRPSNGTWYVFNSSTSALSVTAWGVSGDKPVPGDYSARGFAAFAVFRPGNGTWYIFDPIFGLRFEGFGLNGDMPLPRDFDGDGKIDLSVFRPGNGTWYIKSSNNLPLRAQLWGQTGDIPAPGDFGGPVDGKADLAVFRPSNGTWYVLQSLNNTFLATQWGQSGDIPQPCDFSGPSSNFGVFRPSTGTWYVRDALNGSFMVTFPFGTNGDVPVTASFIVGQ